MLASTLLDSNKTTPHSDNKRPIKLYGTVAVYDYGGSPAKDKRFGSIPVDAYLDSQGNPVGYDACD